MSRIYGTTVTGPFADVTLEAGVEMGRWAWSSDFIDLDNDGRLDIHVQNGYMRHDLPPEEASKIVRITSGDTRTAGGRSTS